MSVALHAGKPKGHPADVGGRRLNAVHRSEPDRTVSIDAWPGTVYAEAVQALDAVRLAGWTEVAFVGSRE